MPAAFYLLPMLVPAVAHQRHIGMVLLGIALLMLLSIVGYQAFKWWPVASEWQREHFWRRCGFVVLTAVDVPLAEIAVMGLFVVWRSSRT
jgi:hypothetical protein